MQHHPSTSTSGVFEIVARDLPYVDRRALSQAWYTSLHIAERERELPPVAARAHSNARGEVQVLPRRDVEHHVCEARAVLAPILTRAALKPAFAGGIERAERRGPPTTLAARIARAFTTATPRGAATFDIEHGGTRVRVMMRSDGAGLRFIALCQPAARASVARALDEARFLLASRGVAVSAAQAKAVRA